GVSKKLGNGRLTDFWNERWVGNQSLRACFPRLFSMSTQQYSKISEMGRMGVDGWRWDLTWRREFFAWEEPIFQEFLAVIDGFQQGDQQDSWRWISDPDEGFTAKSAYSRTFKSNCILLAIVA
ncbi:hypothetical protein A2U01_0049546, partial [Trifolium medium]|nr:hypothetical protein [Trifolium medium]